MYEWLTEDLEQAVAFCIGVFVASTKVVVRIQYQGAFSHEKFSLVLQEEWEAYTNNYSVRVPIRGFQVENLVENILVITPKT